MKNKTYSSAKMAALIAFAGASGVWSMTARANEFLANPDGSALYFVHANLAHEPPPYEKLAGLDNEVMRSDEFHRNDAIRGVVERLRAKSDSVAGAKFIEINLRANFGEYDPQYGEYDFDINDGVVIPFSAFGKQINVALVNGNKAQIWSLDPGAAAEVLKKTRGSRAVLLKMKLEIVDSPPVTDNQALVINTRILEYEIASQMGNTRLGNVIVKR